MRIYFGVQSNWAETCEGVMPDSKSSAATILLHSVFVRGCSFFFFGAGGSAKPNATAVAAAVTMSAENPKSSTYFLIRSGAVTDASNLKRPRPVAKVVAVAKVRSTVALKLKKVLVSLRAAKYSPQNVSHIRA